MSKQTLAWCRVYLVFPFAPAIIESVIRLIFGNAISLTSIPAYSTALVGVMAVSTFLRDELARYQPPDRDPEILSELVGFRSTMSDYFLISAVCFGVSVALAALHEDGDLSDTDFRIWAFKAVMLGVVAMFVRRSILLQTRYKLSVSS